MKKILFILFFITAICSSTNAIDVKNKIVVTIPHQDSSAIKIPAVSLKVGESGIVTREVQNNEFILGNAIVSSINDGVATITITPFEAMNERYMPRPLGEVGEKDKIIFRILYARALILAPNQNVYQEVLSQNKGIDFIHPDIFATFLAQNDVNMPDTDSFKMFCDKFSVGLIFIATNGNTNILDCQSFRIIDSENYPQKDSTSQSPFWTRISDESLDSLFDMDKMQDFSNYYTHLIHINNADFVESNTKAASPQSSDSNNSNEAESIE